MIKTTTFLWRILTTNTQMVGTEFKFFIDFI
jgi:hypothetical protein